MLCNSYLVKLLAKVFHHLFNHRFFNCASMAFRWFFVKFALLKWIWALLNCLSPRSLNTLWSLHMTLATLFDRLTPSLLLLSRAVLWYLSLTSTFRLHQTSSLHLELCFITRFMIYKQDSLLSSKYAFSAKQRDKGGGTFSTSLKLLRDPLEHALPEVLSVFASPE